MVRVLQDLSIEKPEEPERNLFLKTDLDIISYDIAVSAVL